MGVKLGNTDKIIPIGYLGSTPIYKSYLGETPISPDTPGTTYIQATGGTITFDGDFKIHTFTSGTGSFAISAVPTYGARRFMEVLVVAGGGAGSYPSAGGAGGVVYIPLESYLYEAVSGSNQVVVGTGGVADKTFPFSTAATSGSNSWISGSLTYLLAVGGGSGEPFATPSRNGGSGGGESKDAALQPLQSGLSGLYGYGNSGYTGSESSEFSGYGGGGATQQGQYEANPIKGWDGGDGIQIDITGTPTYYGGGGGGAGLDNPGNLPSLAGIGGLGGGGNGAYHPTSTTTVAAQDGTPNTGGGGGGGGGYSVTDLSGNGGSGVVIIRYRYKN